MHYSSVLEGLFLSFSIFSLGSTASISPLQTSDGQLHEAREVKKAGFSKKCWDYKWNKETCVLRATCKVDKKKTEYSSEIDVNTCLANFVPRDATAENEDSQGNFNNGLLNWQFAPMEVYRLKKASGKAILKNACQDRHHCYIADEDLKGKKGHEPVLQCAKQRNKRPVIIPLDIGIGLDDKGQLGCLPHPED
ncbi:hypothetical protein NEUTE1DRAFT_138367 [Neurospora tetrasperma FGSC 2508]|uniref:Cyanovirin-N domain-containing protein n=1 Tax=Neurospora tetrasperma (strain FGSC 2508 / ATCC MYA-4615 / P0657) TaxID=510951 RepID=F8MNP8_NEUT8|nr:uncharacterized protein NEUTE1DRAFT_138367 [Neurospora tetrasperma FGSC 2508]EGO56170.1 hypothetical protein NEUTE1DRAFT_138367 [Neurospora tetrasperma FGSC 2508]EGZ70977.1 hypothetical protein NEUTE2DRAFT_130981 [Neurospora tetrasperma FGSC 2509]